MGMCSQNLITGDLQKTRPANDKYRNGWDAIFGKKKGSSEGNPSADCKDAGSAVDDANAATQQDQAV